MCTRPDETCMENALKFNYSDHLFSSNSNYAESFHK